MIEPSEIEAVRASLIRVLEWRSKKETLVARSTWGDQSFTELEPYIERILKIVEDFSMLPIELMDEGNLRPLGGQSDQLANLFERIDQFGAAEMVGNKGVVSSEFLGIYEVIANIARTEIPWLAIYSGKIQHWLSGAKEEFSRAKQVREDAERELQNATDAAKVAREKAGAAGAAEFTAAFRTQADAAKTASTGWLWTTVAAFSAALGATVAFFLLHTLGVTPAPATAADAVVYLGWKVGTVGLLIGAAAWSGRHYRANRHNHEVNRHREACLENMQAFQRAADDQAVKDMVVLEFSRAATQGMPTGFISGRAEARADLSPQVMSLATRHVPAADTRTPA